MKKFLFFASALFLSMASMAQVTADQVIQVNTDKFEFGKVKQNNPPAYYFEIKNITDKPVVVENTWASCGCTTPDKITEPIAPGATAKLKVQYNAANLGEFNKDVFIKLAGVEQPKSLHIHGEVLEATKFDDWIKNGGKPNLETSTNTMNVNQGVKTVTANNNDVITSTVSDTTAQTSTTTASKKVEKKAHKAVKKVKTTKVKANKPITIDAQN